MPLFDGKTLLQICTESNYYSIVDRIIVVVGGIDNYKLSRVDFEQCNINITFDWSDLGSFESVWEFLGKESKENVDGNLVLGSKKHVEFISLENLILV